MRLVATKAMLRITVHERGTVRQLHRLQPQAGITQRWSESKANAWYQDQPWLVGANYVPATAINQLEMWQAGTFDRQRIDKELRWA